MQNPEALVARAQKIPKLKTSLFQKDVVTKCCEKTVNRKDVEICNSCGGFFVMNVIDMKKQVVVEAVKCLWQQRIFLRKILQKNCCKFYTQPGRKKLHEIYLHVSIIQMTKNENGTRRKMFEVVVFFASTFKRTKTSQHAQQEKRHICTKISNCD